MLKGRLEVAKKELENIKIKGHTGTWYEIDRRTLYGKTFYLMESEIYVQRLEETHVTLEDLRQMAVDVMRYSDPDTYDQEMGIPGIMFELAQAVHSVYTETQERAAKCINAVTLLAQIEKDLRKAVDEKGAENISMHEPYKIMADIIYKFIMAEIEKCPAADADMI